MFRDILQFAPRLAQIYLTVDDKREDKLLNFESVLKTERRIQNYF